VVANDTGGAVAQAFAVRRPDLLRSLTLTNCEADDVMPADDPVAQAAGELAAKGELVQLLVEQSRSMEFARGELGLGVALQYPDRMTEEDLEGYLQPHSATQERAREVERFVGALDVQDLIALKPGLERLEVPTMLVWGTGDRFFPVRLAHWLRDTIPGAREVVEIEGAALFWPGERADELVPHLRRHWAAARAEAATVG
jgi:pimeloyl-ACP methyl ester carboxylesterase